MTLFFIEMHQGLVAKPELRICTSQLASCTFIAGYNEAKGLGGAYHYPAGSQDNREVQSVMEQWWNCLQPTRVTLVFAAEDPLLQNYTTPQQDVESLTRWVTSKGVKAETARTRAAAMSVSATGAFSAGEVTRVPGEFWKARYDVSNSLPGWHEAHGGFWLFDSDIKRVGALESSERNLVY